MLQKYKIYIQSFPNRIFSKCFKQPFFLCTHKLFGHKGYDQLCWAKALLDSPNALAQWSSGVAPTVLRQDHLLRRATHLRIPGYAQRYPSARRRPAKPQTTQPT